MKVGTFDIDLIPSSQWGKSLAKKLPRSQWQKIREREMKRANSKCELCGSTGYICHELWSFDFQTKTQKLIGYKIICGDCDLVMHLGRAGEVGKMREAARQMKKLTGLPNDELMKLYRQIFEEWRERNKIEWKIDSSLEPDTMQYF